MNVHQPQILTESGAKELQAELAKQVVLIDDFGTINSVAGVDVAYSKHTDKLVAAVVVLDAESLDILETKTSYDKVSFPYIPGLFSFRELPPILKALAALKQQPDLVLCDGHGIAHPRRFGLASHLGLVCDLPTIGSAKTRLIGDYELPALERGASSSLNAQDETLGAVLRTQDGIKPVFVSVGHRISLESTCQWVLKLSLKYRLPEPLRLADQTVKRGLKEF